MSVKIMLRKKGQLAEFMAIIILLVTLVIVALFGTIQSLSSFIENLELSYQDYRQIDISTTTNTIGYLSTTRGVPVSELLSAYSCYGNEMINYSAYQENMTLVLRTYLDFYYGEEGWILYFSNNSVNQFVQLTSTDFNTDPIEFTQGMQGYDFAYPLSCMAVQLGEGTLYFRP